jgi:hypothetical protein
MSKRRGGTGAIYQLADGRWEGQFRIGGCGRRGGYGRTRREVLSRLREIRWSASHGVPVSS